MVRNVLIKYPPKILIYKKNNVLMMIRFNRYFGSIELLFEHREYIRLKRIFLILKLYSIQSDILVKNIYLISYRSEEKGNKRVPLYTTIKKEKLIKMNYYEFEIWYYSIYDYNWKYIENEKYYGFSIQLDMNSPNFKEGNVYVRYPIEREIIWNIMPEEKYKYKINKIRNIRLKKIIDKIKKIY